MGSLSPLPVARWKLAATLERRGRTPYALIQASGLARGTVYAIARGAPKAVELDTLVKLAAGLEKLTGEPVSMGDLLELEAAPIPDEAAELAGLAEMQEGAALDVGDYLAELESDQTPEERRAWDESLERAVKPARYIPGRGVVVEG